MTFFMGCKTTVVSTVVFVTSQPKMEFLLDLTNGSDATMTRTIQANPGSMARLSFGALTIEVSFSRTGDASIEAKHKGARRTDIFETRVMQGAAMYKLRAGLGDWVLGWRWEKAASTSPASISAKTVISVGEGTKVVRIGPETTEAGCITMGGPPVQQREQAGPSSAEIPELIHARELSKKAEELASDVADMLERTRSSLDQHTRDTEALLSEVRADLARVKLLSGVSGK